MNLLKKISILILWIDFIRQNKERLKTFGLRYDWIWRIYGVISIPEDIRIYKEYSIDYLKKYSTSLDSFLREKGMLEIAYPSRLDLISDGQYLVVIELKQLKLSKWANTIVYGILLPLIILIVGGVVYFLNN